jgi:hypothetical protein
MIFRAADDGRIRLGSEDMQTIVPDLSLEDLRKRFAIDKNGPVYKDDPPTVIHWSGRKPFAYRSEVYSTPMNFFRRKFLYDAKGVAGLAAEATLQLEDFKSYKTKLLRRLTGKKTTTLPKPVTS